jgi:hypothetical protein
MTEWHMTDIVPESRGSYEIGVETEKLGCYDGNGRYFEHMCFSVANQRAPRECEYLSLILKDSESLARQEFSFVAYK